MHSDLGWLNRRHGSIAIRQDAELRTVRPTGGAAVEYATEREGRGLWLFVSEGQVEVEGETLALGGSLALAGVKRSN